MPTMEKNDLLQSVMQGRLDFFRSCSVFSPLPGAAFQKNRNDSFTYCSGMNYAPCNGILDINEEISSEQAIKKAIEFFQIRKLPFIWWTSSQTLENKGFQFGGILTGIALDISDKKFSSHQTSSQLKINIIAIKEELHDFAHVSVKGFGMEPSTLEQFQAINMAGMNHGEHVHFLAKMDGIPVGTATLSTSETSAGIWNLATLPEYRQQGVATALVSATLAEARKLNYQHIMAILMPKGMAWGLFTKIGFQEVCNFPFYIYGTSAEELEK